MYFCLTISIVKRSTEKTVVVAAVPKTDLDNHVDNRIIPLRLQCEQKRFEFNFID